MESTIDGLARELLEKLKNGDGRRLLIGISGIPASGKTSLAHAIVSRVNALNRSSVAIVCGLDGWHLPRSELAAMMDPQEAFARRGAHWTFDGDAYVDFVQKLKSTSTEPAKETNNVPEGATLTAPTFSHSVKDPVDHGLVIEHRHRLVILEGLYVFVSISPWRTAAELLDERWFVDVDISEARERIVARHVRTGIASSEELALERAEMNDFPNGEFVMANMLEPTRRLKSVEDTSIAI